MNSENKIKRNPLPLLCLVSISGGVAACFSIWQEFKIFDRSVLLLFVNYGISPTLSVVLTSAVLIIIGFVLLFVARKHARSYLLILSFFVFSFGVTNTIVWVCNDYEINDYHLSKKQKIQLHIKTSEKEGYTFIGEVSGCQEGSNESDKKLKFLVYSKTINNKIYYYCTKIDDYYIYDKNIYVVQQYEDYNYGTYKSDNGSAFLVEYDFDWEHIYVKAKPTQNHNNTLTQNTTSDVAQNNNETKSEPQTIIVEHKRELQPVQKWQNCGGCGGSGSCGTCGGSGRNPYVLDRYEDCPHCNGMRKCQMCGGRGGYYYTVLE